MMMTVQYCIINLSEEVIFSELYRNQKYRPMKGDIFYAMLETGETIQTNVDVVINHPENIPHVSQNASAIDLVVYCK